MKKQFIILFCVGFILSASAQVRQSIGHQSTDRPQGWKWQESDPAATKSPMIAAVLSLVLPGLGEWYAGNGQAGKYFAGVDGALWLTYAGFVLHGNWVRDDARIFATQYAGADFSGKDDQFAVDIGNYLSLADYNQAKLRNRQFDEVYTGTSFGWQWQEESERIRFRQMRIKSDELLRASEFVIGALIVNRIISAFSAWRSAQAYNREQALSSTWQIHAEVQGGLPQVHGVGLRLTASF